MKKLQFNKLSSYFTGINIIVLIVIVNIILSFFPYLKIDLTKEQLHTLSPATKSIVANLDDVVNVKVYMTQDLPSQVKPLAADLRSILSEFQRLNKGKFLVTYVDPSKSDDIKNEAQKSGIQPLQFSSIKNDKLEVSNGYLGLKVSYGSKQEVLPVAGDVGNLEYFIVSTVKKLTSKELPKVVLVNGEQSGEQSSYNIFGQFLSKNYQLVSRSVGDTSEIPKDTSVLILTDINSKLEDKALGRINDYLKENKGVMIFEGKAKVGTSMQATKVDDMGLEGWLKDKGITIEPKIIADASSTIATFRSGTSNFMTQYPFWVSVRPENINKSVPASSGLNSLMMPWASPLTLTGNAQPLFSSSEHSAATDSFSDISPTSKIDLGGAAGKLPIGAINTTDAKLAVVGNSTFLQDQFVSNSQENLILALNLVDYLSNDQSLLSIRSKVLANHPLSQVDDKTKQVVKIGNIALPLVILGLLAFGTNIVRKKNNQQWV